MEAYLGGPLRDTLIAAAEDNDYESHSRSQRFLPDSLFEHLEETLITEGQKLFGERPSRGAEYEILRKRRDELLAQRQALRQMEYTTEEKFQDEVADGTWEAGQQRRMAAVQRPVRRVAGKKYGFKRRLRMAVRCNNLTAADWYKLLHDLTNAFGSVSLSALRKARLA